jgi:Ca2+-binding RTX toxin-like protein
MSATVGNDFLSGNDILNDVIDLLAGDDTYSGLGGNDSILGDAGNDCISGGNGVDTIYGGAGDDSISGGAGSDRIYGELGNDSIDAGSGNSDRILYNQTGGEAINAVITSSGGSSGINAATVTTASQGNDTIQGFEALNGSGLGDFITVTTAATAIENLFIFGSSGNDTLVDNYRQGGVFADYNTSSTSMTCGISVDLITGLATDGFGGTDSLVGVTAVSAINFNDTLLGSNSSDRFRPSGGSDSIDGRGSFDILDYSQNNASQAISVNLADGRANDGIALVVGGATIFGADTLISIENVRGGLGNDTIIGSDANNNLRGNLGNDSIDGGGGTQDYADYSNSSASVSVNLETGIASGAAIGTDSLRLIEGVLGGGQNDTLIGGNGQEILRGNGGSDSIVGGGGTGDVAEYRDATSGISVNFGTGVAQDGQGGTDTLTGIEGIWGTRFNDSVFGSAGNECFVGSSGADTFVGGAGEDSVSYGFYPGEASNGTQGVSIDLAIGVMRLAAWTAFRELSLSPAAPLPIQFRAAMRMRR